MFENHKKIILSDKSNNITAMIIAMADTTAENPLKIMFYDKPGNITVIPDNIFKNL
ncbi:MAG: hypothetical protein WCJ54_01820 [Actinomycetota bacterium]